MWRSEMEEVMMKRTLRSKPKTIACYSHLSSFTKLPILTPKLKISLTLKFAKNRLRAIAGSDQRPPTKKKKKKKKKKSKHGSWVKPIHHLTKKITSMIYTSIGLKKSSSNQDPFSDYSDHDDDSDEEVGGRDNDESLEYLMYKLSLALDGTKSSRYIPLMELLNQMRDGGDGDGRRAMRERKVGIRRSLHVFWRRRRRRSLGKSIGRRKKATEKGKENEDEEDEEWEDGEQLCNRRILMGWRCRPIKDDEEEDSGVFLHNY